MDILDIYHHYSKHYVYKVALYQALDHSWAENLLGIVFSQIFIDLVLHFLCLFPVTVYSIDEVQYAHENQYEPLKYEWFIPEIDTFSFFVVDFWFFIEHPKPLASQFQILLFVDYLIFQAVIVLRNDEKWHENYKNFTCLSI